MKALVLKEYGRFAYEEVPRPEPGPGDLLVKVKACAICGSDIHGMDGSSGRRMPPIIMGHEASGVVDRIGDRVAGFKEGDRVTFDSTVYCGECHFCRRGQVNLCDRRQVLGVSCHEYRRHGAFCEFVVVPAHTAYHIPEDLTFERAAMAEPVSIALHAVRRASPAVHETAVVVGAGMIGLLVIQLLKTAGCGQIVAVDLEKRQLELAQKLGATSGLNPKEDDISAQVRKLTDDRGADLAFEVVGVEPALKTAISCVRKGGSVVLVGNLTPETGFPLQDVVTREITLFGSCTTAGEYEDSIEMIAGGAVDVDAFISRIAPLREGAVWFERLYQGDEELIKVILSPDR